jgi:lactoylglutathione lyase
MDRMAQLTSLAFAVAAHLSNDQRPPRRSTATTRYNAAMTSPRPFRILGLQQIAVGGPDKSALRTLWVDLLGLPVEGRHRSERENVSEDILGLGRGVARVEVDLMEPIDPDRSPRVDRPPLNHVGLWVDDLRAAVDWLESRGVRFTPGGIRRGASGHDVCFIHPKGSEDHPVGGHGVLIELVQAPPELVDQLR